MPSTRFRWIPLLAVPLFILSTAACDLFRSDPGGEDLEWRIAVGDTLRRLRVHVPDGVDRGASVRVVMAFHGSNDAAVFFQDRSGLDAEAAGTPTITVYPHAAVGNWAEGCNCNIADRLGIDDIGFVNAMLDTLATLWSIEPRNTFAVGFSQGGLFAYRVGCDVSDRFRAVAAVAAPMSVPLSVRCTPQRPVSTIQLHGTADPVLPWDGTNAGSLSLLSATQTAAFWAARNGCATEPGVVSQDLGDGAKIRIHTYASCRLGRAVRLYELIGYGHAWPVGRLQAAGTILDFFDREAS